MSQREFTTGAFQQFVNEKKLMIAKCKKCGALYMPPRPICMKCQSKEIEWVEAKGKGKLAAFTAIAVGPTFMIAEGFDRNNLYCTGVVQLDEGPRVTARILGVDTKNPAQIKVGIPMIVEFLDRGQGDAKKTYLGFKKVE